MLLRPEGLTDEQKKAGELLCRLSPEVGRAQRLALSFVEVVKERDADGPRGWLVSAQRSEVAEFVSFANGLTADLQAVRAAPGHDWSQGQSRVRCIGSSWSSGRCTGAGSTICCGRGCCERLNESAGSVEWELH
jgi:hypothetical protein